jgi:hypothetical protein
MGFGIVRPFVPILCAASVLLWGATFVELHYYALQATHFGLLTVFLFTALVWVCFFQDTTISGKTGVLRRRAWRCLLLAAGLFVATVIVTDYWDGLWAGILAFTVSIGCPAVLGVVLLAKAADADRVAGECS